MLSSLLNRVESRSYGRSLCSSKSARTQTHKYTRDMFVIKCLSYFQPRGLMKHSSEVQSLGPGGVGADAGGGEDASSKTRDKERTRLLT